MSPVTKRFIDSKNIEIYKLKVFNSFINDIILK